MPGETPPPSPSGATPGPCWPWRRRSRWSPWRAAGPAWRSSSSPSTAHRGRDRGGVAHHPPVASSDAALDAHRLGATSAALVVVVLAFKAEVHSGADAAPVRRGGAGPRPDVRAAAGPGRGAGHARGVRHLAGPGGDGRPAERLRHTDDVAFDGRRGAARGRRHRSRDAAGSSPPADGTGPGAGRRVFPGGPAPPVGGRTGRTRRGALLGGCLVGGGGARSGRRLLGRRHSPGRPTAPQPGGRGSRSRRAVGGQLPHDQPGGVPRGLRPTRPALAVRGARRFSTPGAGAERRPRGAGSAGGGHPGLLGALHRPLRSARPERGWVAPLGRVAARRRQQPASRPGPAGRLGAQGGGRRLGAWPLDLHGDLHVDRSWAPGTSRGHHPPGRATGRGRRTGTSSGTNPSAC